MRKIFAMAAGLAVLGMATHAMATGPDGCTPGYWKNLMQHEDSWVNLPGTQITGVPLACQGVNVATPGVDFENVFCVDLMQSSIKQVGGGSIPDNSPSIGGSGVSLIEALNAAGNGQAKENALLRHATAALLNALAAEADGAGVGFEYEWREYFEIIAMVQCVYNGSSTLFDEGDCDNIPSLGIDITGFSKNDLKNLFAEKNERTCPLN